MLLIVLCAAACSGSQRNAPDEPLFVDGTAMYQKLLAAEDLESKQVGNRADTRATIVVIFASWCQPCRDELATLRTMANADESLRIIGINYFEDFENKSDQQRLREFLAQSYPELTVVRGTVSLWSEFGRPPKVPSVFVFDRDGQLVKAYLRHRRPPPTRSELEGLLFTLK